MSPAKKPDQIANKSGRIANKSDQVFVSGAAGWKGGFRDRNQISPILRTRCQQLISRLQLRRQPRNHRESSFFTDRFLVSETNSGLEA
ncbi:hypothetical protein L484_017892 [Morus notabilis]|uniref:Uncharacterized protein n=1 Tax=Morus notabilis TaxID=981085 RepID=W9S889_9ROSA|nr:hypothetical protein L484_017892 [Morus notabilis]